jgi:alpha-maltose-1-phosphate synthase
MMCLGSMSVVVSHPTGNANLRAVLQALASERLLARFHTTLALPADVGSRRLGQRHFTEVAWSQVRLHPLREIVRQVARRLGPATLVRHETGWASVDAVYAALDRAVAAELQRDARVRAVYAYEDGALASFQAAKARGLVRLYDLPIAHWRTLRRLLSEEAERLPEWAPTMEGLRDSAAKHARKDAEIRLADIVLVASSFTRDSLLVHFGPDLRVSTVPYGCPAPLVARPTARAPGTPLQLFYAGHLSQRKGIADLIAALERLALDWRLTLAGPRPVAAPPALDRFLADPRCRWMGVVPHRTLLEAMTQAHVFVFPSIVEGFGLVITEALASGLPVITTPHTAGPDLLTDGHDGIIVPIRAPDAIAARITQLADDEPLRHQMAQNALKTAAGRSWAGYEAAIVRIVREAIGA